MIVVLVVRQVVLSWERPTFWNVLFGNWWIGLKFSGFRFSGSKCCGQVAVEALYLKMRKAKEIEALLSIGDVSPARSVAENCMCTPVCEYASLGKRKFVEPAKG